MEFIDDLNFGSTLAYERLPESFQEFWEYLKNNTSLAERSIKNYVNSMYQLFYLGSQEFSDVPAFGTSEFIDMIDDLIKTPRFSEQVLIGSKEAINYDQMNMYWNNNYSASVKKYKDYVNYLSITLPPVYAIRTNQPDNVESIETLDATFVLDGIYNYQDDLEEDTIVFSVLGGDKPKWETGFKSIGQITHTPFDVGYKKNSINSYFKVEITNKLVFEHTLTRNDFYTYPDTINAPFIGPTIKGEANQAIRKLSDNHVLGIIRGVIDQFPEYREDFIKIFSEEIVDYALSNAIKLVDSTINNVSINYETKANIDESEYINEWEQKIYYGAPGTGKSYKMKHEYPDYKRVTFHPEYSFTDFVGGLRPVQEEQIAYKFVSGPLTDSIIEALKNPNKKIGLIIEEINRGNTAAIFGDTFQLLDRDDTGWSEYGIVNKEIIDYLAINDIHLDEIKFPSNLSIIATMNNADQGIHVMDSAFKRRWGFEYISIDFDKSINKDELIAGFEITWSEFGNTLNEHLTSIGVEEDKLIGQYFLKKDEILSAEKVASKLFIYLWDDVVRYNRGAVFSETQNFSKLLKEYKVNSLNSFSKQLRDKLKGIANE